MDCWCDPMCMFLNPTRVCQSTFSPCTLSVDLCSPMDLQGLQGHSCLTMICTMGSKGIPALTPGTPLLLHWPWCLQSCSFHMVSPLSSGCNNFCAITFVSLFFNSLSQRCCHHHWHGPALPAVGLSWSLCWLCQTWGMLLAASHRRQPCAPVPPSTPALPKPCHANPTQHFKGKDNLKVSEEWK